MLIIPSIDIKDGRCVRLKQGDMSDATVFSEDPAGMARHWLGQGARRLHVVDLNGATSGKPKNEAVIKKLIQAVGADLPIQLGGGIRDLDTIENYLDLGVSYVVIGTAAVKNPGFLQDACTAFSGHVIVALDAKDGKVLWEFPTSSGVEAPVTTYLVDGKQYLAVLSGWGGDANGMNGTIQQTVTGVRR